MKRALPTMHTVSFLMVTALTSFSFTELRATEGFGLTPDGPPPSQQMVTSETQNRALSQNFSAIVREEKVQSMLAEAMNLTGKGDFEEAAKKYKELSQRSPIQGLQAEARFLTLINDEEKLEDFRNRLDRLESSGDAGALAIARARASLGDYQGVKDILLNDEKVSSGENIAGVLLLANALRELDQVEEAELFLLDSMRGNPDPIAIQAYFDALFEGGETWMLHHPALLAEAIQLVVSNMSPLRATTHPLFEKLPLDFIYQPNYYDRQQAYFAAAPEAGPGAIWFGSLLIQREERFQEAIGYLTSHADQFQEGAMKTLWMKERASILTNIGQHDAAHAILTELAETNSDQSLAFERAKAALAKGDDEQALPLLREINPGDLNEPSQRAYLFNLVRILGSKGDLDALIDEYPSMIGLLSSGDYDFFHGLIFQTITQTEDHKYLEEEIRRRFDDPEQDPPAILWLLAALSAEQARRTPNTLEAFYQWTQADPDNIVALQRLVNVATPLAAELSNADPSMLVVGEDEVERTNYVAEEALLKWIEMQPFNPEPFINLMELYKAQGRTEEARQLPIRFAEDSKDAKLVGQMGYILATNGFPEQALEVYQRALELDPDNMKIRANLASAWTRVDEWDKARDFYRNLLENGFRGKRYHVHEQVQRLWNIAKATETEEEAIEYFREDVKEKVNPEWRYIALGDIGMMMIKEERFDLGIEFLEMLVDEPKADIALKAKTWRSIAMVEKNQGRYFKAKDLLEEAEEKFADDEGIVIDFRLMQAALLREIGEPTQALELILATADEFPNDTVAQGSYLTAAEIAESLGRNEDAVAYYQNYLEAKTTDFAARNKATERINALSGEEVSQAKTAKE